MTIGGVEAGWSINDQIAANNNRRVLGSKFNYALDDVNSGSKVNEPLTAFANPKTGESIEIYRSDVYAEDNPLYVLKGRTADGDSFERTVHAWIIDPRNCDYSEMLVLNLETGNTAQADKVRVDALFNNILENAKEDEELNVSNYLDKADYSAAMKAVLAQYSDSGIWDSYLSMDKWQQSIKDYTSVPVYFNRDIINNASTMERNGVKGACSFATVKTAVDIMNEINDKMIGQGNNINVHDKFALGLVSGQNGNLDETAYTANMLQQITDMRSELDSFFGPFFMKYLVEDVDLDDYPDIAGKISEELSSEKVSERAEPEERVTPLGFGFANAGMMGYGMSAALVEKPGCDDTIIRVKISTGSGHKVIDVNLSKFDSKNATPVEMFAYCQYKDAIGERVNNKWGSWNALKGIALTENGADFGSLDNIMNKKMNWNHALAKSQTSYMDQKTNEIILSPSDLIKFLEDSHKLTAQELKEEKDWREMTDEEWDKMLEGIDKYIDAFKERLRQMKEMQEEAAQKAALEADSDMRATAASSAALSAAASGLGSETETEAENSSDDAFSSIDGEKHEKNWTKNLKTDDRTILRKAQRAQEIEKMAQRKIEEIVNDSEYGSHEYISVVDKIEHSEEGAVETKETLKLIAMDISGIRCINDDTHGIEWEIKFNSEAEQQKTAKLMKWLGNNMNNFMVATDEKQWSDFLSGKISEGAFKNTLMAQITRVFNL